MVKLKTQIYLGSEGFVDKVQTYIADKDVSEIPKIQRRSIPKILEEYERSAKERNEAIQLAYRSGGYTLEEIGKYYALYYSTVSRIIHRVRQEERPLIC